MKTTTGLVGERIGSLETFDVWQAALAEQQGLFNDVPFMINQEDASQLRRQLEYLEAEQHQKQVRQQLMAEIATAADDFLPLTHRLGALAALTVTDRPLTTKYDAAKRSSVSRGENPFNFSQNEHGIRPSKDPLVLADQVGDELERLSGLLDTRRSVPVVMVWNNRFSPPRENFDEVVLGTVATPRRAFRLKRPTVTEEGRVEFELPSRLKGVEKGEVIRRDPYIQPEDKYSDPIITTLEKLGVVRSNCLRRDPDALYIGSKDVDARVSQAKRDMAAYAQRQQDLRDVSDRRARQAPRRFRK